MDGIGEKLQEARLRQGVDLAEVEKATKIRAQFLVAIESEDWDALPGGAYARGFVRAYADHLGLDGARLAESCPVPLTQAPPPTGQGRAGAPRWAPVAAIAVALLALAGVVGAVWNGGGGDRPATSVEGTTQEERVSTAVPEERRSSAPATGGEAGAVTPGAVTVSLTTTAEVWVCLLDRGGKALIEGVVLPEGATEGPFRSGSFTVSLGNGEVEMRVDGKPIEIPASASPLGYEIGNGGELTPLEESERPTCT